MKGGKAEREDGQDQILTQSDVGHRKQGQGRILGYARIKTGLKGV
jgi:hypothetical protein